MDLHHGLFEGPPPPQARTTRPWPGYDGEPVRHRRRLFVRLFGGQRRARRTR